jgi:hypothetical protein
MSAKPNTNVSNAPENQSSDDYYGKLIRLSIISLIIIVLIIGAISGFILYNNNSTGNPYLLIGMIILLTVSALFLLLFLMAVGFSALDLNTKEEALGLPQGSVRALIALLLILIWVIVSVFLYNGINQIKSTTTTTTTTTITTPNTTTTTTNTDGAADAIKLGQQFYTTMSTLVVAIAAFYFGSNQWC